MQRVIFACGALLALSVGCGAGALQDLSAGQVGCPSSEINISDDEMGFNTRSWAAECRGRKFICSGGAGSSVSCAPAAGKVKKPTDVDPFGGGTAPAAAPSGCQYDTQCKGERICRAGQCVDPK